MTGAGPADLGPLFVPSSVAVIGASQTTGPGRKVTVNALQSKRPWRLHLVNRTSREVFGHRTYPSLAEVPEPVDVALIVTPGPTVRDVVETAAERGVKAAVIVSSGFADSPDPAGRKAQDDLAAAAREAGLLLVGPNSFGIANVAGGGYLWLGDPYRSADIQRTPNVAVVSQTGGLLLSFLKRAEQVHLPVSSGLSTGNEAGLTTEDACRWLIGQEPVDVVVVIAEGFTDRAGLVAAACHAHQANKRIVVLKLGQSAKGGRAVRAHTGAFAGDARVASEQLRALGIVSVSNVEEAVAAATILSFYPDFAASAVGYVMISGGTAALVSDQAAANGLDIPEFSAGTVAKLRSVLPPHSTAQNPLDTTGGKMMHDREALGFVARTLNEASELGAVACVAPLDAEAGASILRPLIGSIQESRPGSDKPSVVLSTIAGTVAQWTCDPAFSMPFVEDVAVGMQSIRACCDQDPYQLEGPDRHDEIPVRPARRAGVHVPSFAASDEPGLYRMLEEYGIRSAPWEHLDTADAGQLIKAARRIGYPVVVKGLLPGVEHKTELGLVQADLRDDEDVRRAAGRLAPTMAGVAGAATLVQKYLTGGVELLAGMTRDPVFGPVVVIGAGGIWTEQLDDSALAVLPVTAGAIERKIRSLRIHSVLAGSRGTAYDVAAACDLVTRFCVLAEQLPDDVTSLEINPFVVLRDGAYAVDALITRLDAGQR